MNEHDLDRESLREDLESVLGEVPEPSEALRAAVMARGARRRRRSAAPRWRIPAAAAAVVVAAALVLLVARPDAPRIGPADLAEAPATRAPAKALAERSAPLADDLNRDGVVNILDAWRLAHSSEAGPGRDELDADGGVTPGDLDRLMRRIVSVGGGAS